MQRTTSKITPIDLNGLATERPFMSAQSGEVNYSDEEEMARRESIPQPSPENMRSSVSRIDEKSGRNDTLELPDQRITSRSEVHTNGPPGPTVMTT